MSEHAALVEGLGGLFWRARDPAGLAAWYERHFGIPADVQASGPWFPGAGPVVMGPFDEETEYFGSGSQAHMVNFRIADLDAFCKAMEAAGYPEVKDRETMEGIGRFAWIADPEGHRIELWEPVKH